jgi:hypothetical protein
MEFFSQPPVLAIDCLFCEATLASHLGAGASDVQIRKGFG